MLSLSVRYDALYRSDAAFPRLMLDNVCPVFSPSFLPFVIYERQPVVASQHPASGRKTRSQAETSFAVQGGWGSRVAINTSAASHRTSQCTSNKLSAPVITLRLRDLRAVEEER